MCGGCVGGCVFVAFCGIHCETEICIVAFSPSSKRRLTNVNKAIEVCGKDPLNHETELA